MSQQFISSSYEFALSTKVSTSRKLKDTMYYAYTRTSPWITEFVGSFVLALVSSAAWKTDLPLMAPVASGCALMVFVFVGGNISGAHYNPAVTFAVLLSHGLKNFMLRRSGSADVPAMSVGALDLVMYVIHQLAGGFFGALVAYALTSETFYVGSKDVYPFVDVVLWKALLAEALFAFVIVYVYLGVSFFYNSKGQQNSFFGLAVGWCKMSSMWSLAAVSGGSVNPMQATSVGLVYMLVNVSGAPLLSLWIYWLGPVVGASLAAVFYGLTHPLEYGFVRDPHALSEHESIQKQ